MDISWSGRSSSNCSSCFLKGVATIDLYITIYISISYTIFKAGAPIHIIIGTTGTGTHQGHSSLFYEATECHADLVIDSECKSLEVDALVHLYRAEVQPQRAVGAARDGDVAASEHARVALREPGQRLDEGVV